MRGDDGQTPQLSGSCVKPRANAPVVTFHASRQRRAFGTKTGGHAGRGLRPGSAGTAPFRRFAPQIACRAMDGAMDVILDGVARAEASLCKVAHVRVDAGFPSGRASPRR